MSRALRLESLPANRRAHCLIRLTSIAGALVVCAILMPRAVEGAEGSVRVGALKDVCPEVRVRLGHNPHVNQVELELWVVNRACATNGIVLFGVGSLPRAIAVNYPPEWIALYGFDGRDSVLVWGCIDTLTPPPPEALGNLYRSPHEIQPGDTMHFVALVPAVPPALQFYAQGFDTIPAAPEPIHTLYEYGWRGEAILADTSAILGKGARLLESASSDPDPRSGVTITFALPTVANVRLEILDRRGVGRKRLMESEADPGVHAVTWDGRDQHCRPVSPGTYRARLVVDGKPIGSRRIAVQE